MEYTQNKVEVVIAHYNENLDWLRNINTKYKLNIITKAGIPYDVPPNRGNEASSYLQFIIQRYDSLPDYTIFVHGHRSDWHHKGNMDEKINSLSFDHPYYNINDIKAEMKENLGLIHIENYQKFSFILPQVEEILGFELKGTTPLLWRPSAQFYVSKDTIRSLPLETYKKLYDLLMTTPLETFWSGRVFEWTWHYIFTRKFIDVN